MGSDEQIAENESSIEATIRARLKATGIELETGAIVALAAYLKLLRQWNRVYNLTGVHELDELVERHVVESLALGPMLQGRRIADVGTGAGVPGIPLAITEPDRQFTLIESRAKRVRFLRHVVGVLKLDNIVIQHCRAEDLPSVPPFDTVLARAVAPPAELIELVRPLTAAGSVLLLLTAAHLGEVIGKLATDFAVRPVAAGSGLRSSIVALERLAV